VRVYILSYLSIYDIYDIVWISVLCRVRKHCTHLTLASLTSLPLRSRTSKTLSVAAASLSWALKSHGSQSPAINRIFPSPLPIKNRWVFCAVSTLDHWPTNIVINTLTSRPSSCMFCCIHFLKYDALVSNCISSTDTFKFCYLIGRHFAAHGCSEAVIGSNILSTTVHDLEWLISEGHFSYWTHFVNHCGWAQVGDYVKIIHQFLSSIK